MSDTGTATVAHNLNATALAMTTKLISIQLPRQHNRQYLGCNQPLSYALTNVAYNLGEDYLPESSYEEFFNRDVMEGILRSRKW